MLLNEPRALHVWGKRSAAVLWKQYRTPHPVSSTSAFSDKAHLWQWRSLYRSVLVNQDQTPVPSAHPSSLVTALIPGQFCEIPQAKQRCKLFKNFVFFFFHFFCQTVKVSNFHTFVHKREALREDTTGRNTQGLHCRPGKGSRALCTSAESQSWMVKVKPVLGSLDSSKVSKKLTTTPLSQCDMFKWWKSRLELDLEFKIAFI